MTEHMRAPVVAALAAIVTALLLMPTHLNAQSCELPDGIGLPVGD